MRELWAQNLTWDDPLSPELVKKWESIKQKFNSIEKLRLSRFVITDNCPEEIENLYLKKGQSISIKNINQLGNSNYYISFDRLKNQPIELHGFCDAAKDCYTAVVYMTGNAKPIILMAKNRLAPIKNSQSIPRLELCSCVLLSELMLEIKKTLPDKFKNVKTHYWSDSQVALAWIVNGNGPTQYIKTRVNKIRKNSEISQWSYVSTDQNPADLGTRPNKVSSELLLESDLWWYGPKFLRSKEWPKTIVLTTTIDSLSVERN